MSQGFRASPMTDSGGSAPIGPPGVRSTSASGRLRLATRPAQAPWMLLLCLLGLPGATSAKVRSFILAGQSNMMGCAPNDPAAPSRIPRVMIWNAAFGRLATWEPLGPGFGVNRASMGPELAIGAALAEAFPEDTIALLKAAIAGTRVAVEWLPPSMGGPGGVYTSLLVWRGMAAAQWPSGAFPPSEGVFWLQGESDGADSGMASSYGRNLEAMIGDFRKDLGDSSLPWVMGATLPTPWPYAGAVRAGQRKVARRMRGVMAVETRGIGTDGVHFTTEGVGEVGRRLACGWLVLQGMREDTLPAWDSTGEAALSAGSPPERRVQGRSGGSLLLEGIPEGSRLRWIDPQGRIVASGVRDATGGLPEGIDRGAAFLSAILPDGRIETRRVPPLGNATSRTPP